MSKKITCLLTTHNKQNMIVDVCNGILNNISELTEQIILVFDGCEDKTEELAKKTLKYYNKKIDFVYTDDVFELKANNAGLRKVENDYVILIQDDMIIKEKDFDRRMLKPFNSFKDVFAVTAQTAHNNREKDGCLYPYNEADRRNGYPRHFYGVREIANRGPLMYDYSDVVKLNFFDEELCPNSYDDHDISYRAYENLGKVSGIYWVDYQSEPHWGTGRHKNQLLHAEAHRKNMNIIINRYYNLLHGKIKNEDRKLT
jgi:glycosyltransferase involved in cell wall biosynthesis